MTRYRRGRWYDGDRRLRYCPRIRRAAAYFAVVQWRNYAVMIQRIAVKQ